MGVVILKRNTGFMGNGAALSVKLDGEKMENIPHDKEIALLIPEERAQISVSRFGAKSNKLNVTDGDVVEITTSKWSYVLFAFGIAFQLLATLLTPPTMRRVVFLLTGAALIIVSAYAFEIYQMKVVGKVSV